MSYTSTVLFAGAGLMDFAIASSGGVVTQAVEIDEKIAGCYRHNFPHTRLWVQDISSIDPEEFEPTDDVHGSPSCVRASVANSKGESDEDIQCALAFLNIVRSMHRRSSCNLPRWVTVENVAGYAKFQSFKLLRDGLLSLGYCYCVQELDAADLGVPQRRKRLWARFALPSDAPTGTAKTLLGGGIPPITKKLPRVGWISAIAHLIPDLPVNGLSNWQKKRLLVKFKIWSKVLERCPTVEEGLRLYQAMSCMDNTGFLVQRAGASSCGLSVVPSLVPSFTVRALGGDGHWRQMDCWTPNGTRTITDTALWQLQMHGCSSSYHWPDGTSPVTRCKGIGNGIPYLMGLTVKKSLVGERSAIAL